MKLKEKNLARKLRKQGYSISKICEKANLAKGSVSLWVRDIELTTVQKEKLSKKNTEREVIERRRITRLSRENARRQIIIDNAKREICSLSKKELWLTGIALYWGEGTKTLRSGVQFSNSDPRLIQFIMRFFKEICNVPKKKFRGHINIHPHLNEKKAEKYWSKVSGIPLSQFYKTSKQQSKASKKKKDSLPFGTFNIQICNTELFLKIKGWIEKLYELGIKKS